MLAATPRSLLTDSQGRPYFLWDMDLTLDEFERALTDRESIALPYLIGKLMRQAKPDDALKFVSPQQIADLWPSIERYLGKSRRSGRGYSNSGSALDSSSGRLDDRLIDPER